MFLNKKTKNQANLFLTAAIIIGILAVVNFFSYSIFYRWDLTQNKDYSISDVSKKAVGQLDDIVRIKAYFSENLPSQYLNLRQEVGDILDEYANYSKGNIKVEFIDPKDDQSIQKELYAAGIPQLQFNVLEKDKYQVVNGYLGMSIEYGGKKEVIPVVQDTNNLEYQLTVAIKKVTGKIRAVIGYVTSNGTLDESNGISVAYKKLQELYDVQNVDLSSAREVPANINTLVIAGPKEKFSNSEQGAIDDFLMKGGRILFMIDGVKVDNGLAASNNDLSLDNMFAKYGIKLNHDLVLDISSGLASFSQGFITFATNYPFWPKIVKEGFDHNNAAVAKLESLVLPWVSSVEITDNADKTNQISYLAKTTGDGWHQTDNFNLNPQTAMSTKDESKQYSVAVSDFGKFESAFGNQKTGDGRIILVGDSDFINDNFVRNTPDNLLFFQNIVDSLNLDADLINIRSKGVSERPIKDLSDGTKAAIRYLNIFGLTVFVVVFGMIRYFLRKRSRAIDEI